MYNAFECKLNDYELRGRDMSYRLDERMRMSDGDENRKIDSESYGRSGVVHGSRDNKSASNAYVVSKSMYPDYDNAAQMMIDLIKRVKIAHPDEKYFKSGVEIDADSYYYGHLGNLRKEAANSASKQDTGSSAINTTANAIAVPVAATTTKAKKVEIAVTLGKAHKMREDWDSSYLSSEKIWDPSNFRSGDSFH